jgi:hypothetical protein
MAQLDRTRGREPGRSQTPGASAAAAKKPNRSRRLFWVDASFFALFLLVINVPMTGLTIHEWLGIAIAAVTITHLVQHGDWVASMFQRVLTATSFQNRVNYVMMIGLFIGFASIIVSGLLISQVALPFIGYTPSGGSFWLWLHLSSVGWVVALVAIHIAMNWKWIASTTERLVFAPMQRFGGGAS